MSVADVWRPSGAFGREDFVGAPAALHLAEGEALWIDFNAGDLISLSSEEKVSAHLAVLDERGADNASLLGLDQLPFNKKIRAEDFFSEETAARLAERKRKLPELKWAAYALLPDPAVLRAAGCGALAVICPGAAARTAHGGGGGICASVQKAPSGQYRLPAPLGEIREEIHVPRGTARAYEVAAGEYVQVIDAEGRQCSDFMAMNARALDAGRERHIDTAVTRTLAGGAYPLPGLYDKFFDQDMQPLLSVEQDTVGRHDTFALACTARGYEERGFPGHANCSDNISGEYAKYGIAARPAWPAINFFFNSWIAPHDSRLRADEAWSRPGDYVLMRALARLVCVSTACPDDIDPINGWNPTDICVRIYSGIRAGKGLAHRSFPSLPKTMTTPSPFHKRTAALTSRFAAAKDIWTPAVFDAAGAAGEYWACRQNATVQDMSALRKLDVCGPDAERFLQFACSRDMRRLAVHRSVYALFCDRRGAIIDDATIGRLAPSLFRVCYGSDELILHLRELAEELGGEVWLRDKSRALCNLAVQGPKSRDILREIIFTQPSQPRLENLKWFGLTLGRLDDRNGAALMVSRTGYTGELGYELFCDRRDAEAVWDAVMSAGEKYGAKPMGAEALEILRIEAGLMANNADFGGDITPAESGLEFAVDKTKENFSGKDALMRHAPVRRMAGLRPEGRETPACGDAVFSGRRPVGVVTSAAYSPQLERAVVLARLHRDEAAPGNRLEIGKLDGHIKRLSAAVCEIPFIDPERKKPRG